MCLHISHPYFCFCVWVHILVALAHILPEVLCGTHGLLSRVINIFVVLEISYIHLLSTNSVQLNVSKIIITGHSPLVMSLGKIN
jgi:hypothetical protein